MEYHVVTVFTESEQVNSMRLLVTSITQLETCLKDKIEFLQKISDMVTSSESQADDVAILHEAENRLDKISGILADLKTNVANMQCQRNEVQFKIGLNYVYDAYHHNKMVAQEFQFLLRKWDLNRDESRTSPKTVGTITLGSVVLGTVIYLALQPTLPFAVPAAVLFMGCGMTSLYAYKPNSKGGNERPETNQDFRHEWESVVKSDQELDRVIHEIKND